MRLWTLLVISVLSVSCKTTSSSTPAATTSTPSAPSAPAAAVAAPSQVAESLARPDVSPIRFDYDAHLLPADAQVRLQAIASYMQRQPGSKVRITGHADQRGTAEYNLALGDARARAARDYLIRLGVAEDRIRFQTRGEEEPADPGDDEAAWARNRRDEIAFDDA